MASPDVVCQPCGSALGAPTKECSTAHKTLFLPRNGSRGAPTSDTRGVMAAGRAVVSILLQPRNHGRVASRHRDRPRARRSRKFSRAVVAPHRAVTTVRCAGSAAPRCGSRRTCRTAARCSASSSPRASTGSRISVRCSRRRAKVLSCGARQCTNQTCTPSTSARRRGGAVL